MNIFKAYTQTENIPKHPYKYDKSVNANKVQKLYIIQNISNGKTCIIINI